MGFYSVLFVISELKKCSHRTYKESRGSVLCTEGLNNTQNNEMGETEFNTVTSELPEFRERIVFLA